MDKAEIRQNTSTSFAVNGERNVEIQTYMGGALVELQDLQYFEGEAGKGSLMGGTGGLIEPDEEFESANGNGERSFARESIENGRVDASRLENDTVDAEEPRVRSREELGRRER